MIRFFRFDSDLLRSIFLLIKNLDYMKKIFSFLMIIAFSCAISFGCAVLFCETFSSFWAVYLFGGLFIALILGAFDDDKKEIEL